MNQIAREHGGWLVELMSSGQTQNLRPDRPKLKYPPLVHTCTLEFSRYSGSASTIAIVSIALPPFVRSAILMFKTKRFTGLNS